ncbi:MAG: CHAT domain-containing protein, partial [Phycisphaerae bacterium]
MQIGSDHDAVEDAHSELFDITAAPSANLTLKLNHLTLPTVGGERRAKATATLSYTPAPQGEPKVRSSPYKFTAPLGPIEDEELTWYLERYAHWPVGVFAERAAKVIKNLPEWGGDLFEAALRPDAARDAYEAWKRVGDDTTRRFNIEVDPALPEGRSDEDHQAAQEAAAQLLALPWELLHDGDSYLCQGAGPVRVCRRLPIQEERNVVATDLPLRVLLVSPRPEDYRTTYIDHRVSARPLVDALMPLGKNVELTLLDPPTFPALRKELQTAHRANKSFHVVHFDGHGVYDPKLGRGALCFEHPSDTHKLKKRRSMDVSAEELARMTRDYGVPLFFLEACQSAMTKEDPTASVAAGLLQQGVASVVAMSHSVLVETARRFVTKFYDQLMTDSTIGEAVLAGRQALHDDTVRGQVFGGGKLHLHDWFVPVLFQEEHDPRMIHGLAAEDVAKLSGKKVELSLGDLPSRPDHTFVGRSRELLAAERMLTASSYVVFLGTGGEGKTTLAAELARWLVETQRFDRAVFVCLEKRPDPRNVLYVLGEQLVTDFVSAAAKDENDARLQVERALRNHRTVIVFDNMESVLPPVDDAPAQRLYEPEVLQKLFKLVGDLQKCGDTKLIFTTREQMPTPFDGFPIMTGRLTEKEAIELVGGVLKHAELSPAGSDAGKDEDEIQELVTAVNCHARSLVLIASEVGSAGVAHTTQNVHRLMSRLHERYPDDRERSLFASVELSLQRLPKETRERIR